MRTYRLGFMYILAFGLGYTAISRSVFAATDACKLLTPSQISSVVGVAIAPGKHVTPTFLKTCTWMASGHNSVKFVTLFLQSATSYEGGRRLASQMAAMGKGAAMTPAGVGDDGYYFVAGSQVGLLVKKGRVAFKVAVYATLPVKNKEAMELNLARRVLAKL